MNKNNQMSSKPNVKSPMISIIVPSYNVECYLSSCLDSLLGQQYNNLEIVIVNDGSTDNTGQLAESYREKHPNRIICIHQKNSGVLKARLEGIRAARGEWIGFADGDDFVEKDMYERLLGNALSHRADISHCGFQIVANQGEKIHFFYNTGRVLEQNKNQGLKDLLDGDFIEPSLCNKLFHRSLFDSVLCNEVLTNTYRFNEDLLMNYLLFKESEKSIYEDFCPYHYIARNNSASRSAFNIDMIKDPLNVLRFILEDAEPGVKSEAYRRYLTFCINALHILYNRRDNKELYTEIRGVLCSYDFKSHLLNRNTSIKLYLILLSPKLYNCLYRLYKRCFQKKKYE